MSGSDDLNFNPDNPDDEFEDKLEPEQGSDYEVVSFNKTETIRMTALAQAVKARATNAGAAEIVSEAVVFENYLTGNSEKWPE